MSSRHYKLDVGLSPSSGAVSVVAAVDWTVDEMTDTGGARGELHLALHQSARIQRFHCTPPARHEMRPGSSLLYATEAATLAIIPERPLSPGEVLHLELAYELRPGIIPWEVNRITAGWVELGSYAPWFPLDPAFGNFTYEMRVRTEPGYVVTGNGAVTRTSDGGGDIWHISGNRPDKDCILIASPQLRAETGRRLTVHYADDSHAAQAALVVEDGDWLIDHFRELLGAPPQGDERITLVIAPRAKGGGYARNGFVVLTPDGLEEPARAFRWIAHELAHLWWQRADVRTWEDWLNESFAEYSAVMAVRERLGDAAADNLLSTKRERMPGLPPLRGLARDHEQAYAALYGKGCVLLHDLAETTGRAAFARLLRSINEEGVRTTEEFLELLGRIGGTGMATWFGERLGE